MRTRSLWSLIHATMQLVHEREGTAPSQNGACGFFIMRASYLALCARISRRL
jgi:hypothetical protein